MFSIETYDEAIDLSKTVVVRANDTAKLKVLVIGVSCALFVEWFSAMDFIGSWFLMLLRAIYIIGIPYYYYLASMGDENTIIATEEGLYFALSKKQNESENQFLFLEWLDIDCCEYNSDFYLRLRTKFEKKHRDNYSYEGTKLIDLRLRSAWILDDERFESRILISLDRGRFRKWSKLAKTYPIHFRGG